MTSTVFPARSIARDERSDPSTIKEDLLCAVDIGIDGCLSAPLDADFFQGGTVSVSAPDHLFK